MRILSLAIVLGLSTTLLVAQQPGGAPDSSSQSQSRKPYHSVPRPPERKGSEDDQPAATFKVNVKLVNVFTTVTDKNGAPIGGLKKEDFKIFEDGVQQSIAVFARESALP